MEVQSLGFMTFCIHMALFEASRGKAGITFKHSLSKLKKKS